ncbi:MAG: trypsin-like peptidase domain-containing protein [Brooklawnia sp.]|uniref:S1C family serine protease n=1 Tax=Brooklawnia sp. TaxID=2699740 RepID=UPI003C751433
MSNDPMPNPWSREGSGPGDQPGQWTAPDQPAPQPGTNYPPPAASEQQPGYDTQRLTGEQQPGYDTQRLTGEQQPAAATQTAVAEQGNRSNPGGWLPVLIAALIVGLIGGGLAGYAVTRFNPTPQAVQTDVVQADPSAPDWTAVAEAATQAVVAIQVVGSDGSAGQGSGVVIDAEGHIVTNNHVVATSGARSLISVTLGNVTYAATIVGTDPSTDLAVIQLTDPPAELSVMGFADPDSVRVGDPVMAIGNPLGLNDTVTTGIVSALNRPVTTQAITDTPATQASDLVVTAAIQTNAAINPGNSGGALVNESGQLVGVTSSIATLSSSRDSQAGNIGLGFAIASDQVQYVAEQLISQGYADQPQIGLSASDTTGVGQLGARVVRINEGSPAEQAGIQVGDLITALDGEPVSSTESLVAQVRAGRVGEQIVLTVVRDGQTQEITVTPIAAAR